jgi:hypothetical protein
MLRDLPSFVFAPKKRSLCSHRPEAVSFGRMMGRGSFLLQRTFPETSVGFTTFQEENRIVYIQRSRKENFKMNDLFVIFWWFGPVGLGVFFAGLGIFFWGLSKIRKQ